MISHAARRASSPERILVRGVNWLGDAVMTTPALLRLRQARPEAQITLFTPEKLAEIWKEHPAVDAVLTFSRPEALWRIARRLRQGQFQIGLALPNSHRSALELWLAGIPRRIGCDARWRNWFLTDCVRSPAGAVKMRKRSIREIRRLVRAGYGDATVPAGCASFPGTAHHVHQYLRLAAEIQTRAGARWFICGGQGEVELATHITAELTRHAAASARPAPVNLAGRTSLRELCALLKACRVLLTNDTGPMHVAVAVGTPVVAIFGSTSPDLTGPGPPGLHPHYSLTSTAPCSPCFLRQCPIDFRCMTSIGVPRVVAAVLKAAEAGREKKL